MHPTNAPIPPAAPLPQPNPHGPAGEVARLFFKLGCIAFGGPAAHIALMREEVVRQRRWLDDQSFLDLLGATNLIPGPNSTEMAIHIGYVRAGWRGLILAGTLFILPAMLIVLALAWAYVRFGNLPQAEWLLYGIKPVILAVVLQALWSLSKTAVKGPLTAVIGIGALALYFIGVNEIALLIVGGLIVLAARTLLRGVQLRSMGWLLAPGAPLLGGMLQTAEPVSLVRLFGIFLKIGSVLYGSGYVLLAFLRSDLVLRTGWLTDQQLLDAVAIGQFTPGPVFTTATFIGYVVAGVPGALLATLGIFLPSFFFVALIHPLVGRVRSSRWAGPLLDGVNVASLGLMAAVTLQLGRSAIIDPLTAGLALVAAVLLVRYKINSAWLVLAGGVIGVMIRALA
jgi:chromate transporter